MPVNRAVIVSGSRHWTDFDYIAGRLDFALRDADQLIVIEGGALGADTGAREWAEPRDGNGVVAHLRYDADWDEHGKAAGPIRNKQMLDVLIEFRAYMYAVRVWAFKADFNEAMDRGGTENMCRIALGADIPVLLHDGVSKPRYL